MFSMQSLCRYRKHRENYQREFETFSKLRQLNCLIAKSTTNSNTEYFYTEEENKILKTFPSTSIFQMPVIFAILFSQVEVTALFIIQPVSDHERPGQDLNLAPSKLIL